MRRASVLVVLAAVSAWPGCLPGVVLEQPRPPPDDEPPLLPLTNFAAVPEPAGGAVRLSWGNAQSEAFDGARIFRVEAGQPPVTDPQGAGERAYEGDGDVVVDGVASHIDTGLTDGVEYTYTAFARYSGGRFVASGQDSATPADELGPPAPDVEVTPLPGAARIAATFPAEVPARIAVARFPAGDVLPASIDEIPAAALVAVANCPGAAGEPCTAAGFTAVDTAPPQAGEDYVVFVEDAAGNLGVPAREPYAALSDPQSTVAVTLNGDGDDIVLGGAGSFMVASSNSVDLLGRNMSPGATLVIKDGQAVGAPIAGGDFTTLSAADADDELAVVARVVGDDVLIDVRGDGGRPTQSLSSTGAALAWTAEQVLVDERGFCVLAAVESAATGDVVISGFTEDAGGDPWLPATGSPARVIACWDRQAQARELLWMTGLSPPEFRLARTADPDDSFWILTIAGPGSWEANRFSPDGTVDGSRLFFPNPVPPFVTAMPADLTAVPGTQVISIVAGAAPLQLLQSDGEPAVLVSRRQFVGAGLPCPNVSDVAVVELVTATEVTVVAAGCADSLGRLPVRGAFTLGGGPSVAGLALAADVAAGIALPLLVDNSIELAEIPFVTIVPAGPQPGVVTLFDAAGPAWVLPTSGIATGFVAKEETVSFALSGTTTLRWGEQTAGITNVGLDAVIVDVER